MYLPIKKISCIFLLMLGVGLCIHPQWADARAGGGRSMGSRGAHTYSSTPYAQPISRSATSPQSQQPSPGYSQPYNSNPAYGSTGHPFLSGLAGGFLGMGIASMLFGHPMYGGADIGILPFLLIIGVIYFIFRRTRSGGGFASFSNDSYNNQQSGYYNTSASMIREQPLSLMQSDQEDFRQLFHNIQQKWTEGDIARLRQYVTPEMLQYFSEELSGDASRGQANKVEQIQLDNALVLEAWQEDDMDYATVKLQWMALDYTVRLDRQPADPDYIASGSNTTPESAQEFWTFTRAPGGHWLLSAIQQAA